MNGYQIGIKRLKVQLKKSKGNNMISMNSLSIQANSGISGLANSE